MFPRVFLTDILYNWIVHGVPGYVADASQFRLIKATQPDEVVTDSDGWAFWSANECNFKGYDFAIAPGGGTDSLWLPTLLTPTRAKTEQVTCEFEYNAAAVGGVVGPQTARYVVWYGQDDDGNEWVLRAWRLPVDKVFTNTGDKIKLNLSMSDVNIEQIS